MKIAFDGQLFLDEYRTGIAWMAHNLVAELAKYPENECIIRCFTPGRKAGALEKLREYEKMGCLVERCPWFGSTAYKLARLALPLPYSAFFQSAPDVTQFFNYTVPPGVRGRSAVFVHDMAYVDCPQTVNPKTRKWLELSMKGTCARADMILTGSEFSKSRIQKILHVSPERIALVPEAVDHTVYHPGYPESRIRNVVEKYHIKRDYILYLGTIEPRKNLERLIHAYEKLCGQTDGVPQLVLAGGRGWLCDGIYRAAGAAGPQKVRFTGYVDQCDAPVLLCGARMFVFPSLYEGFGMPPLEAMACGTPVITSDAASLPEIAGDAAVTVDPQDTDAICGAMGRLLGDEEACKNLRQAGLMRAKNYTWADSARKLMDVYENMNR